MTKWSQLKVLIRGEKSVLEGLNLVLEEASVNQEENHNLLGKDLDHRGRNRVRQERGRDHHRENLDLLEEGHLLKNLPLHRKSPVLQGTKTPQQDLGLPRSRLTIKVLQKSRDLQVLESPTKVPNLSPKIGTILLVIPVKTDPLHVPRVPAIELLQRNPGVGLAVVAALPVQDHLAILISWTSGKYTLLIINQPQIHAANYP